MHPAVEAALNDWRTFNESGKLWARLDLQWPEGHKEPQVTLTYGVIHDNGFVECALTTAYYYIYEGEVISRSI